MQVYFVGIWIRSWICLLAIGLFFANLRLSEEDVEKLSAAADARFQEYLQEVPAEIREFTSDYQLLKA